MEKEFIPAYRRLIDALSGRCTRPRAQRTADELLDGDVEIEDIAPELMATSFYEMNNSIITNDYDTMDIVLRAEERLDDYRLLH